MSKSILDQKIDSHNIIEFYGKALKKITEMNVPFELLSHISVTLEDGMVIDVEPWAILKYPVNFKQIEKDNEFNIPKIKTVKAYMDVIKLIDKVETEVENLLEQYCHD